MYPFQVILIALLSAAITTFFWYSRPFIESTLKHVYTRYIKRKTRKSDVRLATTEAVMLKLLTTVKEQQKQIDNLAAKLSNRETNLKQRIRAEVKKYLEELRND